MKLWKKVYLITMIVITLSVNLGFFGIVYFTYEHMLLAEKERAQAEFGVIYESMCADIAMLEEKYTLDEQYFANILTAYNSYFEKDTLLLGVWDERIIGDMETGEQLPFENGIYVKKDKQTCIYMTQTLSKDSVKCSIILKRTLYDFDATWSTLLPLYVAGGIILSLGVSFLLAMVVKTILKPLDELERVAGQLEQENWSARTDIRGKHELAHLGRQFNSMAEVIEEHVQKLQEQSEQKEQLIHNLAHEMNTPITSIQGFADYMQMTALSEEEQSECLRFIQLESKRLKEISQTLLTMAVVDNNTELIKNYFSIKDMCLRLKNLYEEQFKKENIIFNIDCQLEVFLGDEVLIESLLRNLINNAYHATLHQDNPEIKVCISADNTRIQFAVSDNGCGIQGEDIEYIFEPFYRADKARNRTHGGSGLGLSFCKKIVEAHGGTIQVESKVQEGTRFIIDFTIS